MVLHCQIEVLTEQPITKMYRLAVSTSAQADTLTPTSGKRLVVTAMILGSVCVSNALTSTLPAYVCFGTGKGSDKTKCIWCGAEKANECHTGSGISVLHVVGEIDEVIELTNVTFSVGDVTVCATIFYYEE